MIFELNRIMKNFLESTKDVPSNKEIKSGGIIFFLPKSLLKNSCKITFHEDLDCASRVLDLKG